jgi:hypothetical protein
VILPAGACHALAASLRGGLLSPRDHRQQQGGRGSRLPSVRPSESVNSIEEPGRPRPAWSPVLPGTAILVTERKVSFSDRLGRWRRGRRIKRQAGIRTWTRPLGGSGLPAEAEAWVMQIEDELRISEARITNGAPELEPSPAFLAVGGAAKRSARTGHVLHLSPLITGDRCITARAQDAVGQEFCPDSRLLPGSSRVQRPPEPRVAHRALSRPKRPIGLAADRVRGSGRA